MHSLLVTVRPATFAVRQANILSLWPSRGLINDRIIVGPRLGRTLKTVSRSVILPGRISRVVVQESRPVTVPFLLKNRCTLPLRRGTVNVRRRQLKVCDCLLRIR